MAVPQMVPLPPRGPSAQDRIGACLRLAEHWYSRFQSRREFEWKVAFGLWALLLAGLGFLQGKQGCIPLWCFVGFALAYSFVWLRGLWAAHERDKRTANYFAEQAEILLNEPLHTVQPSDRERELRWSQKWLGFIWSWGTGGQLVTTLLLLAAVYYVMQYTPNLGGGNRWPSVFGWR